MKQILQKTLIMFSTILLLSFGNANATTYTFIGPGVDWNTSTNWSGGLVPMYNIMMGTNVSNGDIVNINAPCTYTAALASFSFVSDGTINLNAEFTVTGFTMPFYFDNFGTLNVLSTGSIVNTSINNNNGMMMGYGNGAINIDGTLTVTTGYEFNNYSSINISSTGVLNIGDPFVFSLGATAYNYSGGTIVNNGLLSINSNSALNNTEGIITNNNAIGNIGVINNGDVFALLSGTITNSTTGTIWNNAMGVINNVASSSITNSGTINNENTIWNDAIFTNNASGIIHFVGNTNVINGGGSITNNGTINTEYSYSGTFANIIGGNGTYEPGGSSAVGYLYLNSSATQNFSGDVLNFNIMGVSNNDQIILAGNASLTGATINITLDIAYIPTVGDAFTLIDANSFTTTAPTVNLPTLPSGKSWSVSYTSGNMVATIIANTALPVTLIQFTATQQNNAVALNWSTSNEINFSHYEIEYSTGAKNYTTIGTATANRGTENNYTFVHQNVTEANNYYRLKMVDIDGKFSYSKVVLVRNTISDDIIFSANPVKEGSVVTIHSSTPYEIYTLAGAKINTLSNCAKGIYIVKNKAGKTAKLIIE